ncbi:ankyrin repeat-containing domain protein [Obelidium mucronatum]|nr:ankyrin repeat-containing domain protein [Obelidium mucronatum]
MSPTTRDHLGYSWACEKNHIETVHLFLSDSRIDPGYNENESLSALLKHGLSSIVKNLLLEGNRVDPSLGRYTLIRSAAAYGLTDLVELLLKDPRVDPSAETSSALALAAGHGHLECVQVLMKDGRSDPSTFDDYAIRRASENGFYKVVELLLTDIRVNPAAHDNTPLRKSVENGHIEIVRLLMRCHQVKPFVLRDAELLLLAGERNHINILELFLSDPRMSSLWLRDSAINSAAEQGIVVVVKRMMDFPGELNLSQAFCSAIRGGHVTVVETLMNSNRFENRNLVAGITLMVKERSLFFNSKIARLIIGHRGFIAHDGKAVNGVDKMTDDEMYQVLRQYVEAPEVNEILERFLRSEYL